jgi:hypothetical protein
MKMKEVTITDLDKGFRYKEGDCVIVQTKHYGPYYGHVGAVDPDGSIVVRHNVNRYPEHPSGATYVNVKYLGTDVTLVEPPSRAK